MPLLFKLLFLLLIALPVYGVQVWIFKGKSIFRFYAFVVFHALLLTAATLTVLNSPEFILSDEVAFLGKSDWFIPDGRMEEAGDFVKNNFLLINTSYDKQLLPNPDETEGDSTYIAVTDRNKLKRLLRILNDDSSQVDLVVCDIGFSDTSVYDSGLCNEMQHLYENNKLLISVAGSEGEKGICPFPDSIKGDVKEATNEKLFLSHKLKRDYYYSLSYQVYVSMNDVRQTHPCPGFLKETFRDRPGMWVMNTYLPHFFITDELLLDNNLDEVNGEPVRNNGNDTAELGSLLIRNLGTSIKDDGEDLLDDLAQRKADGKKNILFLGNFKGEEDVHKTAYAMLHGPVILLNLIYSLESGQNRISLLFVLILFVFFLAISFFLCCRVFYKVPELNKIVRFKMPSIKWYLGKHKRLPLALEFFILDEIHYFILLILVIVVLLCTGITINAISLAIYFVAAESFSVYFGELYFANYKHSPHKTKSDL